ncbi:glycoside hydrolase family 19 protein [Aureispira sp. CCB-QB1]|uniref:glycoside hydrolase family 19 protein n=1 Tax=Aureispira sp. CCB-QB1 TaxID=1313421 RepID=UPI0006971AA9|nr:glycoside hydrolase family 19 protein [Aureispira sp. CCB-QB1]
MKKETLKWVVLPLGGFLVFLLVIKFLFERRVALYINACTKAFGKLDALQKESIEEIIRAFDKYGDKDPNKLAYILATARHESNFRPIEERRASATQVDVYNQQNEYWSTGYYGRGFVQLTWKGNYSKMSDFLGVNLIDNPHLALDKKYAARILVYGMMNGSFSGKKKKLSDYINEQEQDYYNARNTVNGTDRAERIKNYTLNLQQYL